MKNRWLRLLSLFLTLALLVQMMPTQVIAAQVQAEEATVQSKVVLADAQVVEEVISSRTEFSKEFMLDNGLHVAALYAEAVHYDAGGTWEEIDNTLKSKLDGTFTNTAGLWDVAFPRILNGAKEITITKDGYTLSFGMAGELRQQGNLEIMSNDDTVLTATIPEETVAPETEQTPPETESTPPEETTSPETAETQSEETAVVDEHTQASSTSQSTEEAETVNAESAAPEETVPETTVPEETQPETTAPEETEPETTVPEETEPEETAPDETEPETTEAALEQDADLSISADTATVTVDGISQSFAVSEAQSAMGIVQSIDKTEALAAAEYEEFVLSKSASRLLYSNIYGTTDLQYDLRGNQLKESIILEAYSSTLRGYRYTLNVGTMVPVLNEDGSIYFYDENEEEIVLVMPTPYLVDANHEFNHDIHISLTGGDGTYTLIYLLPQAWLADSDRAWPVVLDPVVTTKPDVLNIKDRTIASNGTFTVGSYYLEVGYGPSDFIERAYLKYDELPALTSSDVIVAAQLQMYKPEASYNGDLVVEVHKVPNTWESETITWENNKNNYDPTVEDYAIVFDIDYYQFDVTDIVREWYEDENTGLMFKASDAVESACGNSWKRFYSSDIGSAFYVPTLAIVFRNANGLEGYWDYTSASAGRAGTGYVNNFTGNLVWTRGDIGFGGNVMPVSINHVYNANDAANNDFFMGFGWRTNFNQLVYQWKEDSDYYIWEDADGTKHYFERESYGVYKDEDNLKLTLKTSGSGTNKTYSIIDEYDNASYFDTSGRLIRQENNQFVGTGSNKTATGIITITYDGTSTRISSITDGIGRRYAFTYADNLLNAITYTGTENANDPISVTVSYGYDEDENLIFIEDPDGETCTYEYAEYTEITTNTAEQNPATKHILVSATDANNLSLNYQYIKTSGSATGNALLAYQPYRVLSITESDKNAAGNIVYGGSLTIEYAHNQTTFTDHNGNHEILLFNDLGNVISIQDGLGRAQYAQFAINDEDEAEKAEEDKQSGKENTSKVNQLKVSSKLQYTVSNIFTESSFESGNAWNKAAGTSITPAVSTTEAYFGNKALVVDGSGVAIGPAFSAAAGKTYTFSAYVKTEAGATAKLALHSSANDCYSDVVPSGSDWTRIEVTYTNTGSGITFITPQFITTGTSYMDCVQLELAPTASRYNLVENGDFRSSGVRWTANNPDPNIPNITCTTTPNIAAPQLTSSAYVFTGDPLNKLNVSQKVQVSGEAGDTFVIAGWAKGDAAALTESEDYPREFGIVATFHYTEETETQAEEDEEVKSKFTAQFNPDTDSSTNWQYSAQVMIAEKAYDYITVEVVYDHNVNIITFDGIQLYKEAFGSSYTYDEDGKLVAVKNLQGQTTEYTYNDKNDLIKEILPSGAELTYTYDDNHNVITATSAENLVYTYTYDRYGNNESVTITNNDVALTSTAYYTDDGNRLVSTTDTAGNTTYYDYHPDTNVLLSVQYPNDISDNSSTMSIREGTCTYYEYDDMYRLLSAEKYPNTTHDLLQKAEYTYTNDLLTHLETPTTAYRFDHTVFNLRSCVRVGSQRLATYTYTDNDYNLKTLEYSNLDSVEYEYDDHGRIIKETYKDKNPDVESTVTYQYDNSGALATITDSSTERTTTYYYDFTDRLMKYVESGSDFSHSVGYAYDTINNLTSLVESINGIEYTTAYTYDKDNRITSVTNGTAEGTYTYDLYGRLSVQATENGDSMVQKETFTYRVLENGGTSAQVEYHRIQTSDSTLLFQYLYDANGNITEIKKSVNGSALISQCTYSYDQANQLIRENNLVAGKTWEWEYDASGNILNRKEYSYTTGTLGTPTATIIYSYNDNNWGDLLTAYNGQTIAYDNVGNPLSDGTWNYTWQHGRQLASMKKTDNSVTWNYIYDANGMRTKRTDGANTYNYIYNGSQLSQMDKGTESLYFAYDAAGSPMTVTYDTNSTDTTAGTVYYYITNIQGDVIGITDNSGNTVVTYSYDAWGNILDIEGSRSTTLGVINPLRYRSYVYDQETGLYYLQSRYYNPAIGRFINADAYISTGQGLLCNNMFTYCVNNPIMYLDYSGDSVTVIVIGGVAITAETLLYYIAVIFVVILAFEVINSPEFQEILSAGITELNTWVDEQMELIKDKLTRSIARSSHKNNKQRHRHHIVPKNDLRAAPASSIVNKVLDDGVNNPLNLIEIPATIHAPLHTNEYMILVNILICTAYHSADGNEAAQKANVMAMLALLREMIQSLESIA